MKAVVIEKFGAPDVMRVEQVDAPEPAADEVLIRVAATSVNRPDVIQRQGHYPPPPGASEILGLECAGTVAATGAGVHAYRPGDRVFALLGGGGYAELAVADARHVVRIPDALSFEQAACVAETYITAWHNLYRNAALADGESVLVHGGSGGVGTAAIQLVGSLSQRSPILATVSTRKCERAEGLGDLAVIDYESTDFATETRRLTGDRGADVILDHLGAGYLERNLRALAVGGRLVIIGIMHGDEATLRLGRLLVRRQRIIGSVLRPRSADDKAAIIAEFTHAVMPLLAGGRIVPVIDSVLPLERVVDAHRRMEAGRHFGKIVLAVGGED